MGVVELGRPEGGGVIFAENLLTKHKVERIGSCPAVKVEPGIVTLLAPEDRDPLSNTTVLDKSKTVNTMLAKFGFPVVTKLLKSRVRELAAFMP